MEIVVWVAVRNSRREVADPNQAYGDSCVFLERLNRIHGTYRRSKESLSGDIESMRVSVYRTGKEVSQGGHIYIYIKAATINYLSFTFSALYTGASESDASV